MGNVSFTNPSKTSKLGSLVGISLFVTFLMFVINFNHYIIPHWLFISTLSVNAAVSIVCYLSYCVLKIASWKKFSGTDKLLLIPKVLMMAVAVYFTASFTMSVLF